MAKAPKVPKWLQAARAAGKERPVSPQGKPDWIGRALPRAGILSVEEAEEAIKAGRVRIGPRTVREPLAPVPADVPIFLDGRPVSLAAPVLVLAFHKPEGVVTSAVDQSGVGTVFQELRKVLTRDHARFHWHAVGRLDRNTTGLLLFTNDERVVAHVTHPDTHLSKTYLAQVLGTVTDAKLEPLRRGMELNDGLTRPAKAKLREPGVVALTLTEGRNHQVKRMLGEVGLPVTKLHREAIGKIHCDVPVGTYRVLSPEEIQQGLGFPPS